MSDSIVHLALPGLLSSCVTPDALPEEAAPLWCDAFGAAVKQTVPVFDASFDMAGLSYLADYGELPARPCWRCDPVYLQSDLSRVFLFDAVRRELTREEAEELVRAFNGHFSGDGLELVFTDPQRWYLFGLPGIDPPPHVLTTLIGRDIQGLLPRDSRLSRLLTEAQMLFHAMPMNSQRQAEGKMPVNGVWIHGKGALPERASIPWTRIYSDSAAERGLARYLGIDCSAPPECMGAGEWRAGRTVLVRSDTLLKAGVEGHQAWLDALERLEHNWLQPLWRALQRRQVDALLVDDAEGTRFCVERRRTGPLRRRLFGRKRPLREWVKEVKS